jgi:hypothetical protein
MHKLHRVGVGRMLFRHYMEAEFLDCMMAMRYVLRYEVAFRGGGSRHVARGWRMDAVQHFADTYGEAPVGVDRRGAGGGGAAGPAGPAAEGQEVGVSGNSGRVRAGVSRRVLRGFYGADAWKVIP